MHYIGVDIVEISRIQKAIDRWGEKFLRRVFTSREIVNYERWIPSLAVRFAGKEAVMKALGSGGIDYYCDIEIISEPSGKPLVILYGRAKQEAEALGLSGFSISLSHSHESAVAVAIGNTN